MDPPTLRLMLSPRVSAQMTGGLKEPQRRRKVRDTYAPIMLSKNMSRRSSRVCQLFARDEPLADLDCESHETSE